MKEEANYSKWKGQRQRKRTIFPCGRAKDRKRGRLFHVEGPETDKEEDYSKCKIFPCGRSKDKEENCSMDGLNNAVRYQQRLHFAIHN